MLLEGKRQPEPRAGAGPAVDLDAPSHVLRVLRGLKCADAHAVSLGGLEGPEQALAHERLAHAASRIGHLDDRVAAFGADADAHFARLPGRIDRVLHQMPEDALEALLVAERRHG